MVFGLTEKEKWKMLSPDFIQRLQRLVSFAPYMDAEMQGKLLELIRDLKAAEGGGVMPDSAVQAMADAVPDQLVRDIVRDLGKGVAPPSGLTKEERRGPVRRGSGWQTPRDQYRSPHESAVFDELVSHFVGGPNDPVK